MRFRQTLFWDVNPKTIDPDKNARYVIARILDFGNDREVRWMWQYYGKAKIRSVVQQPHAVSERTKPLWLLLTKP